MGDTGPCGPSSEIFWDLGPEFGAEGGPKDGGEDRYVEIWNLVFMQFDAQPDGTLVPLPKPSVDTGAGLERNLAVLQGVESIWDIDVFRPLIAAAEQVTGVTYEGFPGGDSDVSLRILAEHGRTMTFLVADGVVPSNDERGYVLRRIIRRAVRHAYRLGARDLVTPALVDATVAVMGGAYPDLEKHHELVTNVIRREEERFRATLQRGEDLLDEVLTAGDVTGERAFFLHDTLGYPIDLTREVAEERGRTVDLDGFQAQMDGAADPGPRRAQGRGRRGRGAGRAVPRDPRRPRPDRVHRPPGVRDRRRQGARPRRRGRAARPGRRRATRSTCSSTAPRSTRSPAARSATPARSPAADGATRRAGARHPVRDRRASSALHRGKVEQGELAESDEVVAAIDGPRRDAIRRNHTATHVLHWALREVLGTAREAGRLVRRPGPHALRLQPLRGGDPGRARRGRGAREPRDHHRREGAPLRDVEGARREHRRDRVLRRQVRRRRARARSG